MDGQECQQTQGQEQVVEAPPTGGLDQCAKACDHQGNDDDIGRRERRHQHQAQDRNQQGDGEKDHAAFDAFAPFFDLEKPRAIGAARQRRRSIRQCQHGHRQHIKVRLVAREKEANADGQRQQQIAIGRALDAVQRLPEPRSGTPQHQHDDKRHSDQHIDRPAIREQPRQGQGVKAGGDVHQLALHFCPDLPDTCQPPHQSHHPEQHRDRAKRQPDLERSRHAVTSSTIRSE